jgi:hypothetical protein
MIYSDRRNAQNAVDSAALAGALEKSNDKTNNQIKFAIDNSISNNGFDPANTSRSITGPHDDALLGDYYLVTVTLTDTTKTYFAQLFVGDEMKTVVTAVAKVLPSNPPFPGAAIVALGDCNDNQPHNNIGFPGGGDNGSIWANGGGLFSNTGGGSNCPINPPSSGDGIHTSHDLWTIGDYPYECGEDNLYCEGTNPDVNAGVPMNDPMASFPEPVCTGPGGLDASGNYQPGTYASIPTYDQDDNTHFMNPGIYCITGNSQVSGQIKVNAPGGVLLFLHGDLSFGGTAFMILSGPSDTYCPGTYSDPSDVCYFKGMSIFAARDNTGVIQITGNGGTAMDGMIYAPNATVEANGGGAGDDDIIINGQIIANSVRVTGQANLTVNYDPQGGLQLPVKISLMR